ncbi:hypothetical protein [Massilia sp. SYSU DXS3249]
MSNLCAVLQHRLARTGAAILLAASTLVGCATNNTSASLASEDLASEQVSPEKRISRLEKNAMQSAMVDGVSTGLALSAGAIEMNPLVSTSPLGLVALTGAKIGLVKLAGRLPKNEKRLVIKTSSAIWGGAAVNNLMVLASAAPTVAIGTGVIAGVLWWLHSTRVYEEADREIAAREEKLKLGTDQPMVAAASAP